MSLGVPWKIPGGKTTAFVRTHVDESGLQLLPRDRVWLELSGRGGGDQVGSGSLSCLKMSVQAERRESGVGGLGSEGGGRVLKSTIVSVGVLLRGGPQMECCSGTSGSGPCF